jgi:putative transposase
MLFAHMKKDSKMPLVNMHPIGNCTEEMAVGLGRSRRDVPVEMIERGLPTHPNPQTIPQDMSKKRHTKEARIRAIREHEAGRSQAEICRQLNITAPTFYRWKKQLGMMTNSDAQRLRTLEKDNKELKQMVADLLLEKRVLKVALEKKL